jgi:hypothetical protein
MAFFPVLKEIVLPMKPSDVAFARGYRTAKALQSVDLVGVSIQTAFISEVRVLAVRH